ncbi:MAG: dihydroorotate dehydrogenase-like protein [Planctomycetota bacterium]
MSDPLATRYLGMRLRSPLVPAASPLTLRLDNLRALEDAGAGAVVLGSLFEERIRNAAVAPCAVEDAPLSELEQVAQGLSPSPEDYLDLVRQAKHELRIPVIASLNSSAIGHWVQCASRIEAAGADALELNLHLLPTDPSTPGSRVERDYLDIVESVRLATKLPLAVKIPPFFSSIPAMAAALERAGAGALVLFQRGYEPEVDLETRTMHARWPLTRPECGPLSLRWISILHGRVGMDLAASGGIRDARDSLSAIAVGAHATMLCTALLVRGIEHLRGVRDSMAHWLDEHGVASLDHLRGTVGMGLPRDAGIAERVNYLAAQQSFHRRPEAGEFPWSCLP